MKNTNIEEFRFSADAGINVLKVAYGMAVFVVLGLLLNASALHKNAELMEFGFGRNICLTAIGPVNRVSAYLHINSFRAWVEKVPVREKKI